MDCQGILKVNPKRNQSLIFIGRTDAEAEDPIPWPSDVKSEKVGLKLNIQKTKIMAPGPVTSWLIDGETIETVSDFILGGSKITADGDCSHEKPLKDAYSLEEKL